MVTSCFVDADHAGCRVTRRSHAGVLIFVNWAPILWFSKGQNTVESSTFGSEFVAMRIPIKMIEGLPYKLRMMGVPLDGPCNVVCDNNAVVYSIPGIRNQRKRRSMRQLTITVQEKPLRLRQFKLPKRIQKNVLADD